jgi:hypothetical protein
MVLEFVFTVKYDQYGHIINSNLIANHGCSAWNLPTRCTPPHPSIFWGQSSMVLEFLFTVKYDQYVWSNFFTFKSTILHMMQVMNGQFDEIHWAEPNIG